MSDEDRDVDVESDEEDDQSSYADSIHDGGAGLQFQSQAEKRAHHNALERKRRDHIKESFHSLRDSVPALQGEKVSNNEEINSACNDPDVKKNASRAQILKQATDYITFMSKKNGAHQSDIDDLKKQNNLLEQQVRALEKAKAAGAFAQQAHLESRVVNPKGGSVSAFDGGSDSDSSSSEPEETTESRRKKLKTS